MSPFNSDGNYSYTLDNSKASVQALAEGQSVTDTVHLHNADNHGAHLIHHAHITESSGAPIDGPRRRRPTSTR